VNTGVEQLVIPDDGAGKKNVIHQCDDYMHCYHSIRLDPSSALRSIIGYDTGFVTTNHHQAIYKLAKGLRMNACSADSIIEGIEWEKAPGNSFMIGVQWHPERMDTSNAFSGKLLKQFLAEARKYGTVVNKVK
jgi:putative glutamine amidotransferase